MVDSILDSTKHYLNIPIEDLSFDNELIGHINGLISLLPQLGLDIPPDFRVDSAEQLWSTILPDIIQPDLIKKYVFQKVKLVFDPPSNSFTTTALQESITEDAWRINVMLEEIKLDEVV